MKIYFVFRDDELLDEPLATQTGAEAYVKWMKRRDRKTKETHKYEIECSDGTAISW